MDILSDKVLFFGGLALSAISAISALFTFLILKRKKKKYDKELNEEYGAREIKPIK